MQWIEVSVPTRSDEIDDVCAQLAELGAGGMVVEDEADFQDFLEHNHQYWDYVDDALEAQFRGVSRIKFYLSDDDDGRAQLASIRAGIGRELTTATVRDSDWENNWRQYYQPIEVGEKLVVVPEWLDAPADGRIALRLDPGLIFGTGSHPTTRMCLAALEQYAGPGKTALDLGCCSGILGIGALLLGCAHVTGCDIDPKAPEVAAGNAALNGFAGDRFSVCAGDGPQSYLLTKLNIERMLAPTSSIWALPCSMRCSLSHFWPFFESSMNSWAKLPSWMRARTVFIAAFVSSVITCGPA